MFENKYIYSKKIPFCDKIENYVFDIYRNQIGNFDNLCACSAIAPFFEILKIKRKAFLKNRSFVDDVVRSETLRNDPEAFILSKLLPVIWDEKEGKINNTDTIENLFLHHVWKAFESEKLLIDDPKLLKLFPSCITLGPKLSCEATFWTEKKIFLCRQMKCDEPKILPNIEKSYLDFNIYDWLEYFGKSYKHRGQPSECDFPIKIAGFLNRLREIRDRLDCRSCGNLTKPDLRYSRNQVVVYDEKLEKFVTEDLIAAYKVTVFYCSNESCLEYKKRFYLSHCLGKVLDKWDKQKNCRKIIDSRDIKDRCEKKRYICPVCSSCCKDHPQQSFPKVDFYDSKPRFQSKVRHPALNPVRA